MTDAERELMNEIDAYVWLKHCIPADVYTYAVILGAEMGIGEERAKQLALDVVKGKLGVRH